ncbi:MAG: hypothetical protein K6T88_14570 [Bacillus sp. (in: Bacteria)]|nr:hypothetical protein [Bacillus sp. (in: firmicutes)]
MTDRFSADSSALGYYYQVRYALYLLLTVGMDEPNLELSIESLDDIVFAKNGTAKELLQTKHHITPGSLTDSSVDLWKSLRIWCTGILEGKYKPNETIFMIITTEKTSNCSATSYLRPHTSQSRNTNAALDILCKVASTSKNKKNEQAYITFLQLGKNKQRELLNNIYILDSSPNIKDIRNKIHKKLFLASRPQFINALYERLEGWWFDRVIRQLTNNNKDTISYIELATQINNISETFRQDNLPIDYFDSITPSESELQENERVFIKQLRLILLSQPRIQIAISDYYKAYMQRSRWVREELLLVDELEKYERRLIDEWRRVFLIMKEDLGENPTEEEMQKEGKALFNMVDRSFNIHIRPKCTESYIMRGSYHILSNELNVGWHPDYVNRLKHLLLGGKEAFFYI